MERKAVSLFILIILTLAGLSAENSAGNVAVLYHGNTQVNREALNFMGEQFRAQVSPYRFSAVNDPGNLRSGKYDVILVLNTGSSRGIDPVLADFIDSWADKSRLVLISLVKGSTVYRVESIPASRSPQGVDAVSAASHWEKTGLFSRGKHPEVERMHEAWVSQVLDLIEGKM